MQGASPLWIGTRIALAAVAVAAIVGLVTVLDADDAAGAAGRGAFVAFSVFATGATLAVGLSCLVRGKAVWPAVVSIAVAGLGLDLLVIAAWLEIDDEAYGKLTAIALVWGVLTIPPLGLAIAIGETGPLSRPLYLACGAATDAAALIAAWLIATAGDGALLADPAELIGDDGLLRALGAALVLVATLWFAALAASRAERDQTLNRTLSTSPSQTA